MTFTDIRRHLLRTEDICSHQTQLQQTALNRSNNTLSELQHLKSSFPKPVKRQFKNRVCNAKFGDHDFWKSTLNKYVDIYAYTHV